MEKKKREKKKKKFFWIICAALAFLAAGASIFHIWWQKSQKEKMIARYEQIRREQRDFAKLALETAEQKEELVIPVDFEALWEINPDIYAWITIPGTEIDYPIVQHPEDNSFYLTRTVEKVKNAVGSIYTELYNKKDFSDPNTVIYGHNMRDGSMFAGLHKYENQEFWKDHWEVRIYTPDAIRTYRIFAAYLYDNRHLMQSVDFTNEEIYEFYLKEIFEQRNMNSVIDPDVEVTAKDRIITLSTCPNGLRSNRYLVQAVLVKEEK